MVMTSSTSFSCRRPADVSILVLVDRDTPDVIATVESVLKQDHGAVEPVILLAPGVDPRPLRRALGPAGGSLPWLVSGIQEPLGTVMERAMAVACGRWIGWLRAGDVLDHRTVSRQVAALATASSPAVALPADDQGPGRPEHGARPLTARMLDGLWPHTGLLVERSAIAEAGGVDSSLHGLPDLDLAIRLIRRLPVLSADTPLSRWSLERSDAAGGAHAAALHMEERQRLWGRFLSAGPAGPMDGVPGGKDPFMARAEILAVYADLSTAMHMRPLLARSMGLTVRPGDLTVLVAGSRPISSADLGVPGAKIVMVTPDVCTSGTALVAALAATTSEHAIVIDGARPVSSPSLGGQFLHHLAVGSVACFPRHGAGAVMGNSLLLGTLFRRSALDTEEIRRVAHDEPRFWYALQRRGMLAELPEGFEDAGASGSAALDQATADLVDADWYRARYHGTLGGADPAEHYCTRGWRAGYDPNPWFRTAWYAETHREVPVDECPLRHFVAVGAAQGLRPHPLFDVAWYAKRYLGGSTRPGAEALHHFLRTGRFQGAVPDPSLDDAATRLELSRIPPAARTEECFEALRSKRARDVMDGMTLLVDEAWYRARYPEAIKAGVAPFEHYITNGWRRGFDPNPWFSTVWYRDAMDESSAAGLCPLEHFVRFGAAEGRRPCPAFDTAWYSTRNLASATPRPDALHHFLSVGIKWGLVPDPTLDGPGLRAVLADVPLPERSGVVKRLWELCNRSCAQPPGLAAEDVEDWATLLLMRKPPGKTPVILVLDAQADTDAPTRSAVRVLPSRETPLFLLAQPDGTFVIRNGMDAKAVAVRAAADESFRRLLNRLRCTRTAAVHAGIQSGAIGAALMAAGLAIMDNRDMVSA